jgi:tetratricopeptide (TPR) repeat protein
VKHTPRITKWAVPTLVLLFLIVLVAACAPESSVADEQTSLSEINRQQGRIMQALYQLEAQAVDGWTDEALVIAGDLWRQAGDLTQAAAYWAAAETEADAGVLRRLAAAWLELQRWSDAVDTLERLVVAAPDDGWAHYQLGLLRAPSDPRAAAVHLRTAALSPAYEVAASTLLTVLEAESPDSLISMRVGTALAESGLWSYAELAFRHAADLNAPYAEALAYVGLARDRQGKDGRVWMAQAVELEPHNALVRYLHGLHLRAAGDPAASLQALILATALDPQNPALYAELGEAYRLVNDPESAERWLRMAVVVAGDDAPRFQRLLGLFYAEEAYALDAGGLDTLQDMTVLLPNDPDVRAGFGWALYTMGETEAALAQLDRALEIDPNNPRTLYYKGRVWLEADNPEGGVRLLERVAGSESPYQAEARQILDNLSR